MHHVGNLDSGEILTTPLDRPITPLSRGERLSQLGRRLDPLVFGGPAQRLTPRQHYRPSPEAWLTATGPSSYSPVGETDRVVWWDLPRDFEPPVLFGMYFRFAVPPVGLSVASISLAGYPYRTHRG